jgi:transposase
MSKTQKRYTAEFRQKMVELARAGRSIPELAEHFEPSEQTIRNWVLKTEREILAKATAWFAREAGTKPKKSSAS